jgi:serine/threonine-protein kinase CHEK1
VDDDQIMASDTHNSQFTQSLLLFVSICCLPHPFLLLLNQVVITIQSQTQSGTRYTPSLTRFYCNLGPTLLMPIIHEALLSLNVKCRSAPSPVAKEGDRQQLRIRIGGLDRRRVVFKGWVIVENFAYGDRAGSFCVMQRDEVMLNFSYLWRSYLLTKFSSSRDHLYRGGNYGKH